MNDKWGRRLFTTGGVVLVLIGLVHAVSLIEPMVAANETEGRLLELMNNYKFDLMGTSRSMMELLRGFSVSFMVAALGLGALDLGLRRERSALLKKVAQFNVVWLAVMIAVSLRYFFVMPTACLSLALVVFVLAWWKLPAGERA
jgi:hypothetical protein